MIFSLEEAKNNFQKWINTENYTEMSSMIATLSIDDLQALTSSDIYDGSGVLHYLFELNNHDLIAKFFDKLSGQNIDWKTLFNKQNAYGLTPFDMMSGLEIKPGDKTIVSHIKDTKVLKALFEAKNYDGNNVIDAVKADVENEATKQNLLTSVEQDILHQHNWGDWIVGNLCGMSKQPPECYSKEYQQRLNLAEQYFPKSSTQQGRGLSQITQDSHEFALAWGYESIITGYKNGHPRLSENVNQNLQKQPIKNWLNTNLETLKGYLQGNKLSQVGKDYLQQNLNGQVGRGYNQQLFQKDVNTLISIQKAIPKYNFFYATQIVLTHNDDILWAAKAGYGVVCNPDNSVCTKTHQIYYSISTSYREFDNDITKHYSQEWIKTEVTTYDAALLTTFGGMTYYTYAVSGSKWYAGGVFYQGLYQLTDGKPVSSTMSNVVVPVTRTISGDCFLSQNHVEEYANYYAATDSTVGIVGDFGMCFIPQSKWAKAGCVSLYGLSLAANLLSWNKADNGVKLVSDVATGVALYKANPIGLKSRVTLVSVEALSIARDLKEIVYSQETADSDNRVREAYNAEITRLFFEQYASRLQQEHAKGADIDEQLAREVSDTRDKIKNQAQDKTSWCGWFGIKWHNLWKYTWDGSNPDYNYFKSKGKTLEQIAYASFKTDGSDIGPQGNELGKVIKMWEDLVRAGVRYVYPEDFFPPDALQQAVDSVHGGFNYQALHSQMFGSNKFLTCINDQISVGIKKQFQNCFYSVEGFAQGFYGRKQFLKKKVSEQAANMLKDKLLLHFLKQDMSEGSGVCIVHQGIRQNTFQYVQESCQQQINWQAQSISWEAGKAYSKCLDDSRYTKCIKLTTNFEEYQNMPYGYSKSCASVQQVSTEFANKQEYDKFYKNTAFKEQVKIVDDFHKLMTLKFPNSQLFKGNYCYYGDDGQTSNFYEKEYFAYCEEDAHGYEKGSLQFIKNLRGADATTIEMDEGCTNFVKKIDDLEDVNNLSFKTQVQYNQCKLQQEACTTLPGLGEEECTEAKLLEKVRKDICIEDMTPSSNIEKLLCTKNPDESYALDIDNINLMELSNFFATFDLGS